MKNKIPAILPRDKHILHEINYSEIHIVDWKNIDNSKGVEVFNGKQEELNSVCLVNPSELETIVDVFKENALPLSEGKQASQCECILFPVSCNIADWILAVETKYANDEIAAFRIREEGENYPQKMVSQIISTIEYFREKEIIDKDRVVHAILSFPNLIADFNSQLFSFVEKEEWSAENLLINKRIRIKGCNSANIISAKRLKFLMD